MLYRSDNRMATARCETQYKRRNKFEPIRACIAAGAAAAAAGAAAAAAADAAAASKLVVLLLLLLLLPETL